MPDDGDAGDRRRKWRATTATHRDEFNRPRAAFLSYIALPRLAGRLRYRRRAGRGRRRCAQEIAGGAPFADVARRESADTLSGRSGGELGELNKNAVDSSFAAAALSLPLKTLSAAGPERVRLAPYRSREPQGRHLQRPATSWSRSRWPAPIASSSTAGPIRWSSSRPSGWSRSALDTAAPALKLHDPEGGSRRRREGRSSTPGDRAVPDVSIWAFQAKPGEESPVSRPSGPTSSSVWTACSRKASRRWRPSAARWRAGCGWRRSRPPPPSDRDSASPTRPRRARRSSSWRQGPGLTYREIGPVARLDTGLPEPELIGGGVRRAGQGGIAGPVTAEDGIYLFQGLERIPADSAEFIKNLAQIRAAGAAGRAAEPGPRLCHRAAGQRQDRGSPERRSTRPTRRPRRPRRRPGPDPGEAPETTRRSGRGRTA